LTSNLNCEQRNVVTGDQWGLQGQDGSSYDCGRKEEHGETGSSLIISGLPEFIS